MNDVDPTRRAVILGVAEGLGLTLAFALNRNSPDAPDVSYDTDAIERVVGLGHPTVPLRVPVDIEADAVANYRERARSLLASAPEQPDIPNEAVSREYEDRYENAAELLSDADAARTPYERLEHLQSARWFAADVSAVYAAFADDLTREAVLARREPLRDRMDRFRDRWRYRGDDPAVAVVVHHEVESRLDHAAGLLEQAGERRAEEGSRVLGIGSAAGTIELARAVVDVAVYLYDRFVETLDDPRPLGPAFDRAAAALVSDAVARCPDPSVGSRVDRDLAYTTAHDLLDDATSEAAWQCRRADEARERTGVATAVLAAGAAERDRRVLHRIRTAVDRGEYGTPRSVAALRGEKLDAFEAVEVARTATPAVLSSRWARGAAREVAAGDRTLSRTLDHGTVDVNEATRAMADYALGRVRAAVTPRVVSRVVGVLDAAATSREG